MKRLIAAVVVLLPGCGLFRPAPVVCEIPEPPAALLRVPPSLPPLPVDLPVNKRE